ncbi:MAG: hypothetical protein EOO42_21630 [Flavobacteriales bacterium]|nr:MAG: hypothetical protein EOO42_21630 [Flavobacteriales bacterium]
MKSIFLSTTLALIGLSSFSQDLPGFRTSNYSGVSGVFSNPANVSQNNYSWDVSLFSVSAGIGNNNASFGLQNLSDLTKENAITDKLIADGRTSDALFSTDIKPISVLISLNRKSGIALTTRARVMLNATDLDGALAKQIADGSSNTSFPYSINSEKDMRVAANAWSEVGLAYGYVLMDQGKHFVKAGLTAKYLAGVANAYANVSNLNATLTQDANGEVYLTNTTGGLEIGTAGVSIDNFQVKELTSFKSTGIGADLGFIYEYRPNVEAGTKNYGNNYKIKVGLSLTDIGSIKYKKNLENSGGYTINTGNPGLNIKEISDQPVDDLKEYFDSNPQYFTPRNSSGDSYNVNSPTMLNLDVDYKIKSMFYINASTNLNLLDNADKAFNNNYYNSFSVTPRMERKSFGLFVPLNYNTLTNLNAGLAIKLGPLFLGSGSILTAVLKESKQADFFFGIRFGAFSN